MEFKGVAMIYKDGACDSADVKYIEDYGKFVAVNTSDRFTEDSSVGVYTSDDGLTFVLSDYVKTNISHCCHNSGISSRSNGHIRLEDNVFLAYAYGDEWGFWPTRMHKVDISLTDAPDLSDYENENNKTVTEFADKPVFVDYIHITTESRKYDCKVGSPVTVNVYKYDSCYEDSKIFYGVTFSGYDSNVIQMKGNRIIPKAEGETWVTAEWQGFAIDFLVTVSN